MSTGTLDLAGKDYFTEKEAAHYCGVCLRQFQKKIKQTPLRAGRFFGKNMYRRTDLQKLIEETAWQPFNGDDIDATTAPSARRHISTGRREVASVARV